MSTTTLTETTPGTETGAGTARGGPSLLKQAARQLPEALRKLDPRHVVRSPVMFLVWLGSVVTTIAALADPDVFTISLAVWLWLTVIFGNLAEAVAEGRGKAQAASLRATRTDTRARLLDEHGAETLVPGTQLAVGDLVVVEAGEVIPGDGDVVEGIASVDESAITGESAPVIREAGGDRSSVTGGTKVLSDRIVVRITAASGETFLDKMIALVEGTSRRKTPNEIALSILLVSLTLVFLIAVATLAPMATYAGAPQELVVLVALLVCLIPTTIGALLSAIGIAGMDRLVRVNVLAMSGRAVEAAGDVSTLLLDKTGTITYGNRQATAFIAAPGVDDERMRDAARLSSLADQTPEGRSIVELALERGASDADLPTGADFIEFTAQTRMSGVDLADGTRIRKGAGSAVSAWLGQTPSDDVTDTINAIARGGGTPLVIAEQDAAGHGTVLGVVQLKDVVKPGMADRFAELRAMGIRTVMVTGDNELTARAISKEAGVDDFLAEATPEDKLAYIRKEQRGGHLVAMTGDGTNDAPALAAADVGVAMNSGTAAAKEAGNMVDLDSDPTKLIDVVEIGKQLLITRGALTTFSIANDVAKYFAIIPAMFVAAYPSLEALNVMGLATAESAILSAVIFNALIIVALIPLALRGVRFRAASATAVLRRNLTIFGLGGLVVPFIGIKLIDLLVSTIPGIG
ncbi:potassium-transporting ATPase subunit KdpB [Aeromicrobium senzhongii]|uniref:Potassium-transporting ATPase ATP-binding subunit n=2 Tax=Aeromicrobium senzhongii TaxID=2663859 RepID=A0ABX6SVZ0_9ACTN|nr:potassium-transporting ATPase subunit KdpB [Aeromicrobium senzhongii]MTB87362.1 potassium-transporting ATPase subunit KdpB [Aeromicrobium senzhongii]QNL95579.1 potassium-transporting ATPase subunit KdpB [Aeromicrobium senzhongii]